MTSRDRELIRNLVAAQLAALERELRIAIEAGDERLRDEFRAEIDALGLRVTNVHERALRELTRLHERRQTP